MLLVPLALHYGSWKLVLGPGFEHIDGSNEGLIRVGVEYGFHFGKYEISPQVDIDFVEDERLLIFGLVFARAL